MASCTDPPSIIKSNDYRKEEVKVYNDVLNDIVDTTLYAFKGKVAVFFLFDTLTQIDNRPTPAYEAEEKYLKLKITTRIINTGDITSIDKYKFISATRYPMDSLVGTVRRTIIQDSIKINEGEIFTGRWLTFSRVCFDRELTRGFLYYTIWCGNLCSGTERLDVEKVNGTWKVVTRTSGPVS